MENVLVGSHEVKINDRKHIVLSGIKKIASFDREEFVMESHLGVIVLKGTELELIKLDTHEGNLSIKGLINNLSYMDEQKKNKDESLWSKLFK